VAEPVRLAIANDYEVVVRGVAAILEPYASRVRVVDLNVGDTPDAFVDVTLYDVFGTGEVHTGSVQDVLDDERTGVVAIYTSNTDPSLVDHALRLGVRGYLPKSLGAADLVDAIEQLAAGQLVILPPAPRDRTANARRWPGKLHDLTEREAEVLALITQGYDNETIARRLYVSPNTIKTRIRHLYRKMEFENRVQAAVWGMKHGFETDSGADASNRQVDPES
jgi:DNA-binding NarL/FixJ family response regulator